jgi:hypothetical protein
VQGERQVTNTGTANDGGTEARTEKPRYFRRLFDKVLVAFHQACDQNDHDAARGLLTIMETLLGRSPEGNQRKSAGGLVAAHERLWHLRHPSQRSGA